MKLPEAFLRRIEDTYAEAFEGLYCRMKITGERGLTEEDTKSPFLEYDPVRFAAYRSTSTPATVVGRTEAGIEKWLSKNETPDCREGVIVQFWGTYNGEKPLDKQLEKLMFETSLRIRQDILSASGGTTSVFDACEKPKVRIGSSDRVGDCGGNHETHLIKYGRPMTSVPLMMGEDFPIDDSIGIGRGISGANFWIMCDSVRTGREAGKAAIEAIKKVKNVITPFYICPSGSMVDNYKLVGPPTNHPYCPTLKDEKFSKVPKDVNSIPEIVIDGTNLRSVKKAMREGIAAALKVDGVKKISAGSYGGKLGKYKISLKELFNK